MAVFDQILPGVYGQVVAGDRDAALSARGTVAMALDMSWGAPLTILLHGNETINALGYDIADPKIKLIREVLQNAGKLILYRLNAAQGQPAQGVLASGVNAVAVCNGTRGNDISVSVTPSDDLFVVRTSLGTREMDAQAIKTPADFKPNAYIKLTGEGQLESKTVALSSGTDGEATKAAGYDAAFTELQKHEFNVLAYTGTDSETKAKYIAFLSKLESAGIYPQCVMNEPGVSDTGVINNTVGGATSAYTLTASEACATAAGIMAGCGIEESATFKTVDHWISVNPQLDRWQQQERTAKGEFLFVQRGGRICTLYDINTLTKFDADHPADWSKNLVVRTLSTIVADLNKMLEERVIGRIRNSKNGRAQIKGMAVDLMSRHYQDPGYIEDFSAADVTVADADNPKRDSVKVTVGVRVVDTADKIYLTVISK